MRSRYCNLEAKINTHRLHTGGNAYSTTSNKTSYDKILRINDTVFTQRPSPLPFEGRPVAAYVAVFATRPGQHNRRMCTNIS